MMVRRAQPNAFVVFADFTHYIPGVPVAVERAYVGCQSANTNVDNQNKIMNQQS